ncbi:sialate O-acetylesterase [Flavobacterium arsenatis]|uniref:Sialate O-acetylesterase n=1 Tax=Flavobacterium arsenatis TaxID=1484332 RepID=A0ABU1TRL8_9FLAO|nr:sialate O-acetylesterase [Flavobacterium arsenatis]MDR6968515.1 sialate O-acetylesterase [Flavobacterium arsenatis]
MKKIITIIILFLGTLLNAQIKLPRLISDGMVLQRDAKIKLWGWASPNEKIQIDFNNKKYTATTSKNGEWTVILPSQKAGGPYQMTLSSSNKIVLNDILFGDVWILSGQSNMELPMQRVKDKYTTEISKANNPNIRHFLVPDKYDFEKENTDVDSGEWKTATPENVLEFSAVGYFFANEIYTKYKVPIGLINSALGGSPAEAWLSETTVKKFPEYAKEHQKFKDGKLITQIEENDKKVSKDWYELANKNDEGLKNNWKNTELNDLNWQQMNIPGYWASEELGYLHGVVWFRKEFNLSKIDQKTAHIELGRIVDADSVFVNGNFIGTTSYQYPPRKYTFDTKFLKEGKNEIVVRVINNSGKGGFVTDKPYELVVGNQTLDLKGKWKYKLGAKMEALPSQTFIRWKPVGLYNAMIAPLTNYSIKGVLWYQGESSTKNPAEYGDLMETLITSWRAKWNQGNFPFLYVQLANYMAPTPEPTESNWAALRQQQKNTLAVANTGMATIIDIGEWNDIHPLNKFDVGKRLALQAQKVAYGEKKIVASGPLFESIKKQENKLILSFSDIGSGLISKDGKPLQEFAIAGKDEKFVWANAKIEGDKVVVWSDAVLNPEKVRYAWADNPDKANLFNKENLPASPFEASLSTK